MEQAPKRGAKYSIEVNRMSFVMFQFRLEEACVWFFFNRQRRQLARI